MVKHIFVINLDEAEDRWEQYKDDDRYTRWSATHYEKLEPDDPIFKKMISYHNINKKEHKPTPSQPTNNCKKCNEIKHNLRMPLIYIFIYL